MSVTPGLSSWRAMSMTQATTAVANTVPAGSAIGIGDDLHDAGVVGLLPVPDHHRRTRLRSVEQLHQARPASARPRLITLQGGATGGRVTAALLGIAGLVAVVVVFALVLRSGQMAERFGVLAGRAASQLLRLVRRPPVAGWELATVKFRA
jgi:putative heme transporter